MEDFFVMRHEYSDSSDPPISGNSDLDFLKVKHTREFFAMSAPLIPKKHDTFLEEDNKSYN